MKRIIMAAFALICMTISLNAQSDVEKLLNEAEAKANLADANPTNARMQYDAAKAFFNDKVIKITLDRVKKYASKAINIALEEPVQKDTVLGLSYDLLGQIYLGEKSYENAIDSWEIAIEAYEKELGKYDPVTIGKKFTYACSITLFDPYRGYPLMVEAFNDNEKLPSHKRIKNMDLATILLEISLEQYIAEQNKRFKYTLPEIVYEGEKYVMVQTRTWSMESPLIGWFMPLSDTEENQPDKFNYIIIMNEKTGELRQFAKDDNNRPEFSTSFTFSEKNPGNLEIKEFNLSLKKYPQSTYNQILEKYLELKNKK